MSGLLERYYKNFKKNVATDNSSVRDTSSNPLGVYKRCLKDKEVFSCRFEVADAEGNLSLLDKNGVKVVLPAEVFQASTPYYNKNIKDRFIATMDLSVMVKEIDEENMVVTVKSAVGNESTKGTIIKNIFKELNAGNHPVLMGIVTEVRNNRATVNILNQNIFGFINAEHWQPIYTRSLEEFCQRGDVVEFEVEEAAPKLKGLDYAFFLDRRNIAPDPWKALADFKIGDAITVKCVERPKDKDFWWGISKSTEGIEILCNYSEHVNVMKDAYYKCKIRSFNREKHILKVVPFEVVPVGIATKENISFAKNRKN